MPAQAGGVMAFYFPDMWFHRRMGHLYPWDVRFDPSDAAHLSLMDDGRIHVRVVTEPAFRTVHLVWSDGSGVPLREVANAGTTQVWEATLDTPTGPEAYSFALLTHSGEAVYRVPAGISNAVERLDRWALDPSVLRRVAPPPWARGAVIYQIFPERFHSGDDTLTPKGAAAWGSEPGWLEFQGGDLVGIAAKAGYLSDLGVDAVYVNPIFRSPSTHRYDAIDYYQVDPTLGGNEALRRLVTALHEHDIRLIVDASFNHCHPAFFAFADVVLRGSVSEYRDWFVIRDYPPRVIVRPHRFEAERFRDPDEYRQYLDRFREEAGLVVEERDDDGPAVEPTYEAWYGVPSLPRVNLTNPQARRYFLDVAAHWVREYDIDGWRMDVARYVDFDFWPEFRAEVKAVKPDAYLLSEIMGDAMPWLQGDTFDGTMNYTFRQLCLDFVAAEKSGGDRFVEGLVRMYARYAPAAVAASQNLLSSHDTARFLHEAGEDPVRLALATVLQMTLPGAPGIYYGDEVGMTGGEEPASRGAFPWHAPGGWHLEQFSLVRTLGGVRRAHPALQHGQLDFVAATPDAVAYTRSADSDRVVVVVNRGRAATTVMLDAPAARVEATWGEAAVDVDEGTVRVEVAARSAAVVDLT